MLRFLSIAGVLALIGVLASIVSDPARQEFEWAGIRLLTAEWVGAWSNLLLGVAALILAYRANQLLELEGRESRRREQEGVETARVALILQFAGLASVCDFVLRPPTAAVTPGDWRFILASIVGRIEEIDLSVVAQAKVGRRLQSELAAGRTTARLYLQYFNDLHDQYVARTPTAAEIVELNKAANRMRTTCDNVLDALSQLPGSP